VLQDGFRLPTTTLLGRLTSSRHESCLLELEFINVDKLVEQSKGPTPLRTQSLI